MGNNYIFSHFEQLHDNLDGRGIKLFFNSKIANVPNSKLVFFTNINKDLLNSNDNNIEVISSEKYSKYGIPSCDRFLIYLDYITKNKFNKDDVFVFCDCRDVCFISNIFEKLKDFPNDCVVVGVEDCRYILIQENQFNARWLNDQNPQNLLRIGNNPIICTGVMIVKGSSMASWFLYQFSLFIKYYIDIEHIQLDKLIDQGAFNELYYNFLNKYNNHFILLNNEHNFLFNHMGLMKKDEFEYNNGMIKQIQTGITPSIIHQYDRHSNITEFLYNRYLINN